MPSIQERLLINQAKIHRRAAIAINAKIADLLRMEHLQNEAAQLCQNRAHQIAIARWESSRPTPSIPSKRERIKGKRKTLTQAELQRLAPLLKEAQLCK
jgi:hypothetical protein